MVILGPTAVGKTDLSIDMAKKFNGEIISGDSMQIYKGMDIGTAKIKPEEMKGVPHYLLDEYSPDYNFSVAEFQEVAKEKIKEINSHNHLPIIAGGTGLYIKSVTHQYQFPSVNTDEEYREELHEWVEKNGKEALHDKLKEIDPKSAERLHPNDVKRVIRSLEVYKVTGQLLSDIIDKQKLETPYDLLMIGLTMERSKLYERINQRVDIMLEKGLVDEVRKLLNQGFDERYTSMQGIGYKEIIQYLKGEISLEQAIYMIKQGTRRFAKRQLSWFRQMPGIYWFDLSSDNIDEKNKIKNNIYKLIAGKFPLLQNM